MNTLSKKKWKSCYTQVLNMYELDLWLQGHIVDLKPLIYTL